MKKAMMALLCLATLAMIVACGGKKTEKADAEQENATETTEGTPAEGEEQAAGGAKAELTLTVDSVIPEKMKSVYANGDFKPCPAVFFRDNLEGEKVGEFPSKWDIKNGSAEVGKFGDRTVIKLANNDAVIVPKVAGESKNYLPEVFTLEFEYYCNGDAEEDFNACYHIRFYDGDDNEMGEAVLSTENEVNWRLMKTNDEETSGNYSNLGSVEKMNTWNYFAMSFDKGTVKIYVNGKRLVSLPNIKTPGNVTIGGEGWDDHRYLLTNVRMGTVVK